MYSDWATDIFFYVKTLVRSDSFTLAAIFFAGVLAVLSPFFVKNIKRAKAARKRASYLQAALECQPDGFFLWLYDDVGFLSRTLASPRLSVMLNLTGGADATFNAVLERLNRRDAENLTNALQTMRADGAPFDLNASDATGGQSFLVSGFRAVQDGDKPLLDIVWVRDVTQLQAQTAALANEARALNERAEVLRNIFDSFPFPVWVRNENLRLIMCNPSYAAAVHAQNEDDALKESAELVYEKSPKEARILAAAARAAGREHKTREDVIINGRRKRFEVSEIPLKKQNGSFRSQTLGFARDVTAYQEIDDELQRHIAAHIGVLEHLKTPIAVFDAEMRLTFYNTAFINLFDLDEQWLDASPTYAHFIDVLRDKRKLPENRNFNTYKAQELHYFSTLVSAREDTLHLPNGLTLLRTMTPHPLGGLLIVYEDVTGHLALERSMNLQNDTRRALLDAISEAACIFSRSSRLAFVNKAYEKLWNVQAATLAKEKTTLSAVLERQREFFDDKTDWKRLKELMFGVVSAHDGTVFEITRADGQVLEFSATMLPDGSILTLYRAKAAQD